MLQSSTISELKMEINQIKSPVIKYDTTVLIRKREKRGKGYKGCTVITHLYKPQLKNKTKTNAYQAKIALSHVLKWICIGLVGNIQKWINVSDGHDPEFCILLFYVIPHEL